MSRPGHMEPLVGPVEGPTAGQAPHALTEIAPHCYRTLRTGLPSRRYCEQVNVGRVDTP